MKDSTYADRHCVPASDLRASLLTALDDLSAAEEAHEQAMSDLSVSMLEEANTAAEVQRKKQVAQAALTAYGVKSTL